MSKDNMIQVDIDEYIQLLNNQRFLDALYAVGVDNWSGYSDAWALYEGEDE